MKLLKRAKEKMFFDDILQRLKFDVHDNSNSLEKKLGVCVSHIAIGLLNSHGYRKRSTIFILLDR